MKGSDDTFGGENVAVQKNVDFLCAMHIFAAHPAGPSGPSAGPEANQPRGGQPKRMNMFTNIEDMQKMGKEQFDAASVSANALSKGLQQIATETGDFTKKSYEASTGLFEKLAGVKTLDKAIEIQTEFAKTAYESFVAQATKMGELYTALAKDVYKPVEEAFAKVQTAAK